MALSQTAFGASELASRYPVQDQHDTLAINRVEVETDLATNAAHLAADRKVLASMEREMSAGTLSYVDLLKMRKQVAIEELDTHAIAEHRAAIVAKLTSLDQILAGNEGKFAEADRESNAAILHWYDWELKKAQTAYQAQDEIAKRVEAMVGGGSSSARDALLARGEANAAKAQVTGWENKRAAQAKQLEEAERTVRSFSPASRR